MTLRVRNVDQRAVAQNKGLRFQENIADKKFFQRIISGVFWRNQWNSSFIRSLSRRVTSPRR